jgi:2,2-dialkylglycine decarboxylase (pyruvate)
VDDPDLKDRLYTAGLEKKPVIASARGVRITDTDGKECLDFGLGQRAAALGHNHPRYAAAVERSLRTIRSGFEPPARS